MSALPPKADIDERRSHVRFVPKADILPPRHVSLCGGGLRSAIQLSLIEGLEVTMAKGQMRSNREKKKPKQDKNKKKGVEAPSPFAGMHSQVKLGTSYASQYGKKH
jgi:hypothetical protein